MLLQHPFEVVTTAVDGRVLSVVAGADAWFTIGQVWELSGVRSRDQVRKVLARLAETGILDTERVAMSYRYRLNRAHLAADAILSIATTRQRLLERLRGTLADWAPELVYAALFGSAARGDMHRDSDIDIFLVRDEQAPSDGSDSGWDAQVADLETAVTRWTGNPMNVFQLAYSEVIAAGDEAALSNIKREGIPLYGSPSWLRRNLQPRSEVAR